MGHAFHRKQLPINRTRTHGTGIRYIEPRVPTTHELTPERIAARAEKIAARAEKAVQQAMLEVQRQRTHDATNTLLQMAREILSAWQRWADEGDVALAEFPGWWTTDSFCPLPVDANVAAYYADRVREYRQIIEENDYEFELERLDDGLKQATKRTVPTSQVVQQVLGAVPRAATSAFTSEGFDVERFLIGLEERADRVPHLSEAIDILCDAIGATFD